MQIFKESTAGDTIERERDSTCISLHSGTSLSGIFLFQDSHLDKEISPFKIIWPV